MKRFIFIVFLLVCVNCCARITREETDKYIQYKQTYHDTKLYILHYKNSNFYLCSQWKLFEKQWYYWYLEDFLPQMYERIEQAYKDEGPCNLSFESPDKTKMKKVEDYEEGTIFDG